MLASQPLAQISQPGEDEVRHVLSYAHKLKKEGDFVTAEKLLVEGLNFLKNFSKIDYNSFFRAYLARILFDQKKYAESEPVYRLAIIELEARYGALRSNYKTLSVGSCNENFGCLNILSAMNNFAVVLNELGKIDESILMFKEVLQIKQHIFKPAHPEGINESTLRSIDRVITLLYQHNKYDEAVGYLQSSFNWKRKMFGTCNKDTLMANNFLCQALRNLGRFEEAEYWFEQGSPNGEIPLFPFRD